MDTNIRSGTDTATGWIHSHPERPLDGLQLDSNGSKSWETSTAPYVAEHSQKITGRFTPMKRRGRAMARYVTERIDSLPAGSIEREKLENLERDLRLCRNDLLFKDHYQDNRITLSKMKSCKRTRLCPLCAIARANAHVVTYMEKTTQLIAQASSQGIELRAYLVTLTKKHGVALSDTYTAFAGSVTRLVNRRRDAMRAREGSERHAYALDSTMAGVTAGVFSFEVKRGKGSGLWNVHTHGVLLSAEPIDKFKLSAEWRAITGDSYIVDVQEIGTKDNQTLAAGLCEALKYAQKFSEMTLADNFEAATTLHGKRLIRSFGDYYGLKPDDAADIDDTAVLDSPYIERLYSYKGGSYVAMDTDGGRIAQAPQLSACAVTPSGDIVSTTTADTVTDHDRPPITTNKRGTMLREGRFVVDGSTFTVDAQSYLLRERGELVKGVPQYYLVAVPSGHYVSGLWQKGEKIFSIDYKSPDGSERVFSLDFGEPGYVRIIDKGFSRRSLSRAPWQQQARRKGKRDG